MEGSNQGICNHLTDYRRGDHKLKREYLAAMNTKRSPRFVGLFQYNEIGSLEDQEEKKNVRVIGGKQKVSRMFAQISIV